MPNLSTEAIRSAIAHGDRVLVLDAAQRNDVARLRILIDMGAELNIQDDEYRMTALHYTAGSGKRGCLRLLINSGRCDFTILDKFGRSAASIAVEWGRDYAAGRLLARKKLIQEIQKGAAYLS